MHTDNFHRMVPVELLHYLYEGIRLLPGRRFWVSSALQLHVLAVVVFHVGPIVEPVGVGQIDPQTNFNLQAENH